MTTDWNAEQVDLDGYLTRIGYDGPLEPTAPTLRALHRAHAGSIPFENLDIVLGRTISIDLPDIQDKLLRHPRGGYCYEHNLLFAGVLERIGFEVTGHAARIRMGSDKLRPASHALLQVHVDGTSWLADVGFGGEGLLEPLPLRPGEVSQGDWRFRLVLDGDVWLLQSLHPQGWFDLHTFTLDPQYAVDFAMRNHFTSTHPHSPFVTGIVVQRTGSAARHSLNRDTLVTSRPNGTSETRTVEPADLTGTLSEIFGIHLSETDAAHLRTIQSQASVLAS